MTSAEIHYPLQKFGSGLSAGGHVGIVDPHQFYAFERHFFELVEVGKPAVFLGEIVVEHFGLRQTAHRRVGGISRIGHKHAVARIEQSKRDMEYSLLASYQRQDLF